MKYYYIILLLIFAPIFCEAQWIQVGQDINADEALDNLGSSVAISNDGNIIATGAFTSNTGSYSAGKVKVFQLQGNNWEQLGSDLLGEASEDEFGYSISLSGDGTILAVGARFNDEGGNFAGQVTIYEYQGNDWVQIGQAINGDEALDVLGYSVSLNESGDRVIIGIPERWVNGIRVGQAKVFEYQNKQWIQIGNDINGSFEPVFFGGAVSINSIGDTVLIAGWISEVAGVLGYARAYFYNGQDWIQTGQDLIADNIGDRYGYRASINDSGDMIALSAVKSNIYGPDRGQVKIFKNINNNWVQYGDDLYGQYDHDRFGYSMSFNGNSTILAIASVNENGLGKVNFYENQTNEFGLLNDFVEAPLSSYFGLAIQLNDLGNRVVVGSPGVENWSGKINVFQNDNILNFSNYEMHHQISLYPNPVEDVLFIEYQKQIENFKIYTLQGQIVFEGTTKSVDVSQLKIGLYFIQITVDGKTTTLKFIKE